MNSIGAGRSGPALPSRANMLAVAYATVATVSVGVFGFSLLSVGLPAALLVALLADGIARPGSSLLYPTVTHGSRKGTLVALSFDDGPDPEVTPLVLDALARYGGRATFFTIGRSLQAQPQLARRLLAEGHELGNHTWTHSRWQSFFRTRRQRHDIERGAHVINALAAPSAPANMEIQRRGTRRASASAGGDNSFSMTKSRTALQDVTGTPAAGSDPGDPARPLFRPPVGIKSPPLVQAAWRLKLTLVAWSLHSRDTRSSDSQAVARRVLKKIRPGDIVLMHDGHDLPDHHRPVCAQALPQILQGLREKGLQCVTVSELLRAREVTTS